MPDAEHDVHAETKMTVHERDIEALGDPIGRWLETLPGASGSVAVSDLHAPQGAGMSSVTLLFDANSRPFVARLPPEDTSFPVFPSYDIVQQFEVMALVAEHSDVPVPPIVGVESTGDVIGAPFGVMDAVAGRTPTDNPPYVFGGWLMEATPEERRLLQDETVAVLAGIHGIADAPTVFATLAKAGDSLRAHFDAQRAYYEWTRSDDGLRIPVIDQAFEWLEANWPTDTDPCVLSWGDSRPGNIIYDQFTPVAVLDWEMAGIAPREVDLAWVVFLHRFFQDIATVFEMPGIPDFCRRDEVVATYEELSGHTVRDFDWYLMYAALRHAVVMSQVKRRMIHFGEEQQPEDPNDYVMHSAALKQLLEGTYTWD
jgi:aminoglycoside phosphotransferase (APT) family kinase protein